MKKLLVSSCIAVFILFAIATSAEDSRGLDSKIKQLDQYANAGKQAVVLIAIDKYKNWIPLKNPVKDAHDLKDILVKNYYIDEVHELYNEDATKGNILKLFEQLQKALKVNDSLFIYYAGHGHLDEKTNTGFWIPVNAGNDEYDQENWLPNGQLRGLISNIKASHICLISDSCFSGDILNPMRAKMPTIDNAYFKKAYKLISRQVLTSGASQSVPDKSEFSMLLKMVLNKNDEPYIDPMMLFDEIRLGMKQTTPMFGDLRETGHQEGGSFLLFSRGTGENKQIASGSEKSGIKITEEALYGSIKIQIKEKGKLYVDGTFIKDAVPEKSITLSNIQAGSHDFKMAYDGNTETKTVYVEENKEKLISFEYSSKKTETVVAAKEEKPKKGETATSNKATVENPQAKDEFLENFDGPALDSSWQLVRETASMWSLKERPGSLAIHTEYGDLRQYATSTSFKPFRNNKNMFLRETKLRSFQLDAKIEFNPFYPFHQAGIVIYTDDNNFVANNFGIIPGNGITGGNQGKGISLVTKDKVFPPVPFGEKSVYLRLVKNGNTFTGFFSIDGNDYTQISRIEADLSGSPKVGLVAYGGQEDYNSPNPNNIAYFDFFRISKTESGEADSKKPKADLGNIPSDQFDYLTEFEGHQYYISKDSVSWHNADALCKKYGGHLVTITSQAESDALIRVLGQNKSKKGLWIGLNDERSEGSWQWVTGEKSVYNNWHAGEPNGGNRENYAMIYPGFGFDWLDIDETMNNPWNIGALFILEME